MAALRLSQRQSFERYKTLGINRLQLQGGIPSTIGGSQLEVAQLLDTLQTARQDPARFSLRPGAYCVYQGQFWLVPGSPPIAANWGWEIESVGDSGGEPDLAYSLFLEKGSRTVDQW